jgi:hypothetical protein
MEKIKLKIINPSSSGFSYTARQFEAVIPGHRFFDNPVEIEIPVDLEENFTSLLREKFPHMVIKTVEPEVPEVPNPAGPIPEKDNFFAGCTAKKEADDVWVVTVPGGEALRIEGVTHHKQAKLAAYEKLYGSDDK